jgi:hypothetical protein
LVLLGAGLVLLTHWVFPSSKFAATYLPDLQVDPLSSFIGRIHALEGQLHHH